MIKHIKILSIISIIILLNFFLPINSEAFSLGDVISGGKDFLKADGGATLQIQESSLQELSNTVSGILLTIAVVVTLISAVVMGISFTIQSVEDKAKIKESMIPWVIGIFISFGAFAIWKITMAIFYKI